MFAAWETLCPPSEDTEVTDEVFSVISVLRGLNTPPLYIENYHMRTNGHQPKGKVNLS